MGLGLTPLERSPAPAPTCAWARPVVLRDADGAALVLAAETATAARLAGLRALGPVDLAITGRRAETLKARAYDGDLARVALPARRGSRLGARDRRSLARPRLPDEGPVRHAPRRPRAALHRAAIALCKQAHLLPAALVLPLRRAEAARLAAARAT